MKDWIDSDINQYPVPWTSTQVTDENDKWLTELILISISPKTESSDW